jgi:single-strand DNA-binding protein
VGIPAPQHRRQPDRDSDIRRTSFPETSTAQEPGKLTHAFSPPRPGGRHDRAASATDHPEPRRSRDDHLTGHGRLTRDVTIRTTHSGKTVATISVASDRRDRDTQPVYVDLIVWQAQATAAAEHLVKGQAVTFAGRFEPREYITNAGDHRVALELHGVDIEYGPKPRSAETNRPAVPAEPPEDDMPF